MHFALNIIILLGAVQGFVISALLFFSKTSDRYSNRLLGFLILLIALACLNLYTVESGLAGYQAINLILSLIPFVVVMPFGPLLYFYSLSVIDPSLRLAKKDFWHFSPVIIDLVPPLIVWVFVAGLILKIFKSESGRGWGDFIDEYNAYADIPRWLSVTLYTWAARKKVILSLKEAGKPDYTWLRVFLNFMLFFDFLWFVFLVPYIIPSERYRLLGAVGWYPLYVPMVIIIYWAGLRGYLQSWFFQYRKPQSAIFPSEVINAVIIGLEKAMKNEHRYLDPGLTVTSLSKHIKIPQKTISGVLNQHLKKSFNEYVNEFRVEDVKRRLMSSETSHLTITGIALECGFNSQATFQRAFKTITHLSPTEFIALKEIHKTVSEGLSM